MLLMSGRPSDTERIDLCSLTHSQTHTDTHTHTHTHTHPDLQLLWRFCMQYKVGPFRWKPRRLWAVLTDLSGCIWSSGRLHLLIRPFLLLLWCRRRHRTAPQTPPLRCRPLINKRWTCIPHWPRPTASRTHTHTHTLIVMEMPVPGGAD